MTKRPDSLTLGALLEELAAEVPNSCALTFKGHTFTYSQMRDRVVEAAKALLAGGMRPGDRVGLLLGNSTEWVVLNFAIQYLGGTMVALNSWYTEKELAYVIEHSDISTLFFADKIMKTDYVALLQRLEPLSKTFPKLKHLVLLGDQELAGAQPWSEFLASGVGASESEVLKIMEAVSPDSVAYQLYTSGSTSRPKGVMLIHRHLIENTFEIGLRMHFGPKDVVYMPLSLFWGMGCMNMLLGPWAHRAHIVLQEQFNAEEGLEIIQKYGCTVLAGTPNIIHAIFEHPNAHKYDLSSMRKGTPLGTPEVSLKIINMYMPEGVHCYGLTETHGFATVNDGDDPVQMRANTEGKPMPGWEVRVVDPDTNQLLERGTLGEIRVRGRMMAGYYKNPEATMQSYDSDGFFKTGDLGFLDAEGYLSFKGRFKEMLKTGGINVAPAEVEEVLLAHPSVGEAFVTGIPDDVQGEIIAAAIVPKPGHSVSPDDISEFCKTGLAKYKQPKKIRIITHEDVPLTTTQKVHRMKLVELFQQV